MHIRSHIILTSLIITTGLLAACGPTAVLDTVPEDPWGRVIVGSSDTIQIAVALNVIGEGTEREALEQLRGAEMAIADQGRVAGRPVELITVRTQCTVEASRDAAAEIAANRQIVAVIGPSCATSCAATGQIYDEAHFTAISPGCSATSLTDQVAHYEAFMRTIYDDTLEAEVAARFAYHELGARRVAVVHDDTAETADIVDAFEAIFGSLGGEIVLRQPSEQGAQSVRPALLAVREVDPDLIYAPLVPEDAVRLSLQRNGAGLGDVPVLGGRHYWSTWYLEEAGYTADRVYATGPLIDIRAYEELAERYTREYEEPPTSPMFAYAYDATQLLLGAIERVGVSTADNNFVIGRQALRDELYSTATFDGVTGTLTCNTWGECGARNVAVAQVQNEQWVVIYSP